MTFLSFSRCLVLSYLLMTTMASSLVAQTLSPSQLGVRVEKPAGDGKHFYQGSGIYLGHGLILTASHVVNADLKNLRVTVLMDGQPIQGMVVQIEPPERLDLALIKVDMDKLAPKWSQQRDVAVCTYNPPTNQPVTVVGLVGVARATTISTAITSGGEETGSWTNLLSTGFHQGNSGGGVFNPQLGCLWGILNLELTGTVNGKSVDMTAFVPASKVMAFVNSYRH